MGGGRLRVPRSIVAVVAAVAIAACTSDDGTEPEPAIAIALSTAAVNVAQGGMNTVNLSLSRAGGFAGDVSIAVEGVWSGILAVVGPPSLDPSVSSALITIRVGSISPGVDSVTVRATGTGVTPATARLVITVVAASP